MEVCHLKIIMPKLVICMNSQHKATSSITRQCNHKYVQTFCDTYIYAFTSQTTNPTTFSLAQVGHRHFSLMHIFMTKSNNDLIIHNHHVQHPSSVQCLVSNFIQQYVKLGTEHAMVNTKGQFKFTIGQYSWVLNKCTAILQRFKKCDNQVRVS